MQRPLVNPETYDKAARAAGTPLLGRVPCGLFRVQQVTCIESLPAPNWCMNCQTLWQLYSQSALNEEAATR